MNQAIEVRRPISRGISRKGLATRGSLLEATRQLMDTKPVRDIRVAEIARRAGTATATFYRYFEDVTAAVAAVAEAVEQCTPDLAAMLEEEWRPAEIAERSRIFVNTWVQLWETHSPVLRYRNMIADEGDKRFDKARSDATARVRLLLEEKIRQMQEDSDPPAIATCVLGMLERTASNLASRRRLRMSRERLINAAAFVIAATLGGSLPQG